MKMDAWQSKFPGAGGVLSKTAASSHVWGRHTKSVGVPGVGSFEYAPPVFSCHMLPCLLLQMGLYSREAGGKG